MPHPSPRKPRAGAKARPPQADALASETWLSVGRCYNLCDAVLTQRLAGFGVRLPEHEVLVNLLRAPGLTQKELAQRCFVAKSGISMLVSSLEGRGLLERLPDPQDARARRLSLTPDGLALARQCNEVQELVVGRMTGGAPEDTLRVVRDAMHYASGVLEAMLKEGP